MLVDIAFVWPESHRGAINTGPAGLPSFALPFGVHEVVESSGWQSTLLPCSSDLSHIDRVVLRISVRAESDTAPSDERKSLRGLLLATLYCERRFVRGSPHDTVYGTPDMTLCFALATRGATLAGDLCPPRRMPVLFPYTRQRVRRTKPAVAHESSRDFCLDTADCIHAVSSNSLVLECTFDVIFEEPTD